MGGEEEESISFKEHFQKQIAQRPFCFLYSLESSYCYIGKDILYVSLSQQDLNYLDMARDDFFKKQRRYFHYTYPGMHDIHSFNQNFKSL